MALDQIGAEIRWQSTQLRKLKRSDKGRILDGCDYFDGRKFSLQELKRRHTALRRLIDRSAEFEAALNAPTRREARRRKSAPLHLRLAAYLDPIGRAGGGAWKPCPSYETLAGALGVCIESISQAFRKLEEDESCPLAFACAYSGPSRCRQKHVALKSWLKYDGLPLHFEKKGRHRKLRPTFRKGVERIEPPPLIAARHGRELPATAQAAPASRSGVTPVYTAGNSRFCLSDSIRLSPAVSDNPQRLPAKRVFRPHHPKPRNAALSISLEKAAWRAAREASSDGELFWDNSKVKIPLPTLKTLILEAFQQGFEWKKHVRPALRFGIKEAHAAACLSEVHIRNAGAFAATIFREKLGSMRPDLDHLAQVIEKRRSEPAVSRPESGGNPPLSVADGSPESTPLPLPGSTDPAFLAGGRMLDHLAEFIGENQEWLEKLSPEEAEKVIDAKWKEFTDQETTE